MQQCSKSRSNYVTQRKCCRSLHNSTLNNSCIVCKFLSIKLVASLGHFLPIPPELKNLLRLKVQSICS
nr:MAG TPA: hypothetical protein [Caudoviricetes sp.]